MSQLAVPAKPASADTAVQSRYGWWSTRSEIGRIGLEAEAEGIPTLLAQTASSDRVNQLGALLALEQFESIPLEHAEAVFGVASGELYEKFPSNRVQLVRLIGKSGAVGLDWLRGKLEQAPDNRAREDVLTALSFGGAAAKPWLSDLATNLTGARERALVFAGLGRIARTDATLFASLEEKASSGDLDALRALAFAGEGGFDVIFRLYQRCQIGGCYESKLVLVSMFGDSDQEVNGILDKLLNDEDRHIRTQAAKVLGHKGGQMALDYLTRRESLESEINRTIDEAKVWAATNKEAFYQHVFHAEAPILANPNHRAARLQIKAFNRVSNALQEQFAEKFVAIILFGGRGKGLARLEVTGPYSVSDADAVVVGYEDAIFEEFSRLLADEGIELCQNRHNPLAQACFSPEQLQEEHPDMLYSGGFFGPHERKLEMRRDLLQATDEQGWERVRDQLLMSETLYSKAFTWGLTELEIERMSWLRLLRMPPTFQEARYDLGLMAEA